VRPTRGSPGRELQVSVKGAPPVRRYFLQADESALILLNVSDPALSRRVSRAVRTLASAHPTYFAGPERRGQFLDSGVLVQREGVFLADQKIAGLEEIVERIPRPDVVSLAGRGISGRSTAAKVGIGVAIGVAAFFGLGKVLCCDRCPGCT
jgi:hypothetical protein